MYEMEKFPNPNHNSFLARTLLSFYIHLERERERESSSFTLKINTRSIIKLFHFKPFFNLPHWRTFFFFIFIKNNNNLRY